MRIQLALNVRDLEESVAFYSKMFGAEPNKRKPGYANFAIESPPLKLVLFERPEAEERLNHLGVEVFEDDDVTAATGRLRAAGLADLVEDETTCCYAKANKVWAQEPQGLRWEWYKVLADSDTFGSDPEFASESSADGEAPTEARPSAGGSTSARGSTSAEASAKVDPERELRCC